MSFPATPPSVNMLVVAQVPLIRYTQAGPLPPVKPGDVFWVTSRQYASLIAAGYITDAPSGTIAPLQQLPLSVSGIPGLGAGTSNASRSA